MKKSRETSDSTFAKCLKYLVIGCIAGLFLCAALLAICAFVFVLVKTIPTQAIQAVSIGISALSAMFAGFLSAKLCHSKGLIMGLFSGLIVCLRIDFRLFHGRKCIYRFHCNEVSSDDDWRRVWRCACGKQT